MLQTEVTQGQYESLMGYNPSFFSKCGLTCPVDTVSWHESAAFANELSSRAGLEKCFVCTGSEKAVNCSVLSPAGYLACKGWRLPTEAEWEYAARAGSTTAIYPHLGNPTGQFTINGDFSPELHAVAWYVGNSKIVYDTGVDCGSTGKCGSHAVGLKIPNAWGLYDMLGNLKEWCFDQWDGTDYANSGLTDPFGATSGSKRATRGNSWLGEAKHTRTAKRSSLEPESASYYYGFRLVRTDLP